MARGGLASTGGLRLPRIRAEPFPRGQAVHAKDSGFLVAELHLFSMDGRCARDVEGRWSSMRRPFHRQRGRAGSREAPPCRGWGVGIASPALLQLSGGPGFPRCEGAPLSRAGGRGVADRAPLSDRLDRADGLDLLTRSGGDLGLVVRPPLGVLGSDPRAGAFPHGRSGPEEIGRCQDPEVDGR